MSHSYRRTSDEPIDLFLVEDNPGDVRLTRAAFKAGDSETRLRSVTDGDDAVDLLTREATDESLTSTDFVLLDLNLPGMDGCEVLETIKANPQLHHLPVIMLTSSEADEDIKRCYAAGANAYLTKPDTPDEFRSLVETVEQFWFEHVELPPVSR